MLNQLQKILADNAGCLSLHSDLVVFMISIKIPSKNIEVGRMILDLKFVGCCEMEMNCEELGGELRLVGNGDENVGIILWNFWVLKYLWI